MTDETTMDPLDVLILARNHFAGCAACSGTQAVAWSEMLTKAIVALEAERAKRDGR